MFSRSAVFVATFQHSNVTITEMGTIKSKMRTLKSKMGTNIEHNRKAKWVEKKQIWSSVNPGLLCFPTLYPIIGAPYQVCSAVFLHIIIYVG